MTIVTNFKLNSHLNTTNTNKFMNAFLLSLDKLKQKSFLQIFTIYVRYLIGGAFIIAAIGMGKLGGPKVDIMGASAAPLDDSISRIALFFRVMQESGLYWNFIGWSQIIAGGLLLSQKFSKVGAAIFFGLILNIFIITLSYDFRGTPVITGLILLATIYLLIWDLKSFLFLFKTEGTLVKPQLRIIDKTYWIWLGVIMILSLLILGLLQIDTVILLLLAFLEGLIGFVLFYILKLHKK